ncbi:hypothetical protein GGR26_001944 [Lewinella marina]|uniref:Uncharacterized protein n=1 Tax=Neolewinella marina TaxID=438751 RepID=A0A2G0CHF3_9BACT|nr:PepSY domain-containing protein [Neolewinella marina]NJB86176.1 hypothetical protein [Neolewinella marina]PHK99347.1 hypothetical protein CGL56_07805 [Neolewinella marina]
MNSNRPTSATMRILHRYLGFFLAGIMAVYSISGVVLIFRNTNFLKQQVIVERQLEAGLAPEAAAQELRLKEISVEREEAGVLHFKGGTYDAASGLATKEEMKLPFLLDKMTDLHKANTKSPLYFFNIFFGLSLLFFVISAFWMFLPAGRVLQKGLIYTAAGVALTLLLLFV